MLSHTWGDHDDEVNFKDLTEGSGRTKVGYGCSSSFLGPFLCHNRVYLPPDVLKLTVHFREAHFNFYTTGSSLYTIAGSELQHVDENRNTGYIRSASHVWRLSLPSRRRI